MRRIEVTPVQSAPARAVVGIEGGARSRSLTFELSVPIAATGDLAVPLTLLPSMALGAPLHVDSPVDAGLLERQERIQDRFAEWSSRLAPVPVDAPSRPPPDAVADGVGAFFSGGLDSFYTVLTRRDEITHLILIHGFDYSLTDWDIRGRVAEMARSVAGAMDLEVIEVATDAKLQMIPLVPWRWYHGGLLAGIAHSLERHISRVLIPATFPRRYPAAWGLHPDVDHLWSTARVAVETAETDVTRPEKLEAIVESELAMRWLRVCWKRPGEWNCGRCVKCVRTMVELHACGALEQCRTFPDTIDLDRVRGIPIEDFEGNRGLVRATVEWLEERDADPELAGALEYALGRSRSRARQAWLRRLPVGVIRRARHEMEKARLRLG